MKRRWNLILPAGLLLAVAAFLSYPLLFARFPVTRDVPWVNLALFAIALGMIGAGLARAYRRPDLYRGRVAGPILAALVLAVAALFIYATFWVSRQLPAAANAPAAGRTAPAFTLPDQDGRPVALSDLVGGSDDAWALVVFYRGYW